MVYVLIHKELNTEREFLDKIKSFTFGYLKICCIHYKLSYF